MEDLMMNCVAASKILKISDGMINQKIIFNSYYDEFINNSNRNVLVKAKNILFRDIITNQVKETGRFEIDIKPSNKVCPSCKGTGEMYKVMEVVEVPCRYCNETGVKTERCKTCNGTGEKFGKRCLSCKGSGKYFYFKNFKRDESVPCSKCKGEGNVKIRVRSFDLTGSTTCLTCGGTGLNIKNIMTSDNRLTHKVLSEETAKKLSKNIS